MPYQAFHSQSRVEFIKKKFENSFPGEKNERSLKQDTATADHKIDLVQELKDLNLGNKSAHLKSEINGLNKNEGKALVKRSPAFRREKLGCAKGLTRAPFHKNPSMVESPRKNLNDYAQDKILKKTNAPDKNLVKDLKRAKTDTNLLKHCSDIVVKEKNFLTSSKNIDNSNQSISYPNREGKCDAEKKTLDLYAVAQKKSNKPDKSEIVSLKLSESIRRALQSPLPKGPPPKKPPRTFCYTPRSTQTNTLTTSVSTSSLAVATTKLDITKLKYKVEKLEKAIKNHKIGTFADVSKDNFEEPLCMKVKSCSVPDVTETNQSCLPVLQCLNQGAKISNFKKDSESSSKFYLDVDKADTNSVNIGKFPACFFGSACDQQQATNNKPSPEAIYDLPYLGNVNSFETFGKGGKDSECTEKSKALHYMCTDLMSQTPKYPNFLSSDSQGESTKERNPTDISHFKSNFLNSEEHSASNMSKRSDIAKISDSVANDEKISLRNKKQSCGVEEESSVELESDFIVVDPSGHVETNKKKDPEEEETLSSMTAERKIYVSKVSSKLMSQIPCWKYKNKNSYKHLFECCLLVGLTLGESKQSMPYVKSIFPPNIQPPPLIESLCFPDACYWPLTPEDHQHHHHPEEQCYSLVVTNENGERKFGYCRRVLPEGGHFCLPLAYCIISPHRAGGFFYKVLEELESRHGSPVVENFIKQLYESEFPGPGERLKLKEILEEVTRTSQLDSDIYLCSTLVRRPPDVRLEEKGLTQLFKHLELPVFVKVFSSILLERKVLLLSDSLRNLSSCIEALQSILLPFSWQHTYIPVLPVHLIEMCEAPTPYIIGLLKPRNLDKSLTNMNIQDGILVDLDDSKILKCCGDEGTILPSVLIRDLKTSLNLAINSSDSLSENVRNVLISDAFIRFFVQICGNYSKFIQSFSNGEKTFQKEEFVKSVSSNAMQFFLDWFTETAMFNAFIQERLQGEDEDMFISLFRRRALEYSEDRVKDSLLKNYRVINKKVKTLGGKLKDFTSFTK